MKKSYLAALCAGTMSALAAPTASAALMQLDMTANVSWTAGKNIWDNPTFQDFVNRASITPNAGISPVSFSIVYDDAITGRATSLNGVTSTLYSYDDVRSIALTVGSLSFTAAAHPSKSFGSIVLGTNQQLEATAAGVPLFRVGVGAAVNVDRGSRTYEFLNSTGEASSDGNVNYFLTGLDGTSAQSDAAGPILSFWSITSDWKLPGDSFEPLYYQHPTGRLQNLRVTDISPFQPREPSPVTAVPEPGSWAMLSLGLGLIGWRARGQRAKSLKRTQAAVA